MGWDGPVTHRQFVGWLAWEREDFNHPDKACYYLMLVAQRVQQVLCTKPAEIKLEHQTLRFGPKDPGPRKKLTPEEVTSLSRARWFMGLGGTARIRGAEIVRQYRQERRQASEQE